MTLVTTKQPQALSGPPWTTILKSIRLFDWLVATTWCGVVSANHSGCPKYTSNGFLFVTTPGWRPFLSSDHLILFSAKVFLVPSYFSYTTVFSQWKGRWRWGTEYVWNAASVLLWSFSFAHKLLVPNGRVSMITGVIRAWNNKTVTSQERYDVWIHHKIDCLFKSLFRQTTNNPPPNLCTTNQSMGYRWIPHTKLPVILEDFACHDVIMEIGRNSKTCVIVDEWTSPNMVRKVWYYHESHRKSWFGLFSTWLGRCTS